MTTIRTARRDEGDVLFRIQRESAVAAFSHIYPPHEFPFPDQAIRELWEAALSDPSIEVYVAESGEEPVGTVAIGDGRLMTLYVLPDHWGRGAGATLHDHGLARLRALGFAEARLWTLAENDAGRRFYEKRGWRATGKTQVVPFPPHPLDVEYLRAV